MVWKIFLSLLGRIWKNSGIHLNVFINSTDNSRKGYLNDVRKKKKKILLSS